MRASVPELRGTAGTGRVAARGSGDGGSALLVYAFPTEPGQDRGEHPQGRGVEDDAVICILRQSLDLHGEEDQAAAVAGSP